MVYSSEPNRREAFRIARELIDCAAPGLLSMTEIATAVIGVTGGSLLATRRYLRSYLRPGELIELTPGVGWRVTWPQAVLNGVLDVRLVTELVEVAEKREVMRLVLAAGHMPGHVRKYAPNNVSYLTTPEHTSRFIRAARGLAEDCPLVGV